LFPAAGRDIKRGKTLLNDILVEISIQEIFLSVLLPVVISKNNFPIDRFLDLFGQRYDLSKQKERIDMI